MWRCAHSLYQSLDHGCSCVRCHASGKHVLMCVERRRGGVGVITNHNGLGEEESKRKEEEKGSGKSHADQIHLKIQCT